jgi:hypothetical protein
MKVPLQSQEKDWRKPIRELYINDRENILKVRSNPFYEMEEFSHEIMTKDFSWVDMIETNNFTT